MRRINRPGRHVPIVGAEVRPPRQEDRSDLRAPHRPRTDTATLWCGARLMRSLVGHVDCEAAPSSGVMARDADR
uniref:Uncharacterized protein n=1 Tax=Ralstonia solanacearum TaxID=305 RepID=A0A0S4TX84_RALSL|nr:protein of unknown function [Ralstonia solanacearum]